MPAYSLRLVSLWVYISLLTVRNKGTTTVMKGPFTCAFTLVIARLSKDISEQRKSTRIAAFSLLICLNTTKFASLKLLYPYKETICLKFWANLLIFEKPCLRKIIKDVCMYVCCNNHWSSGFRSNHWSFIATVLFRMVRNCWTTLIRQLQRLTETALS